MSKILITGSHGVLPTSFLRGGSAYQTVTLNALSETCVFAGYIHLENPLGGSKTISAAGGGKIVWKSGAVTLANASTKFRVGIQPISPTLSPTQGTGTYDVYAEHTTTNTIAANSTITSTMTTGTKTIAHGDLVGIVFSMFAIGGSDSVVVNGQYPDVGPLSTSAGLPTVTDNTGGTYARSTNVTPNAYIQFDDGSIGWIFGYGFYSNVAASIAYNSGTATADEYGNYINYPFTFDAIGAQFVAQLGTSSSDFEILLYSDPLGTPVVERSLTFDASQTSGTATTGNYAVLFSSPFTLSANKPYAITLRPTTANNCTLLYRDTDTVAGGGKTTEIGTYCYAVRRLDNTGAFSDYNGGTAKTRLMGIFLRTSSIEQGVNICSGQVGVF